MGGGVAGVRGQRGFEGVAGLLVVAFLGVEHGQVVVGLGQLRVVARQVGKGADRVGHPVQLRQRQTAHEPRLGILRVAAQLRVERAQSGRVVAPLHHFLGIGDSIGVDGKAAGAEGQRDGGREDDGTKHVHLGKTTELEPRHYINAAARCWDLDGGSRQN